MNKNVILADLKQVPLLTISFLVMSLGVVLLKESMLGLDPWGVFHEGIAGNSTITFGKVIEYVGYAILVFSLLLKIYPGLGTILNIILIGNFTDMFLEMNIFIPTSMTMQIAYFIIGLILFNFGKALYISANTGAGPRDGLFVGVVRITKIDVKYVKPAIEILVLVIGIVLGGTFGVGTIIQAFVSGLIVDYSFKLIKYDPKEKIHRSFNQYFQKA